jgi:serine dehydrogenase proteinase
MADIPKERLNAIAEALDADLLVFNSELLPPVDFSIMQRIAARRRRKNIVLFLTTEGGFSDAAFRIMRFLQSHYTKVSVVVSGWCKSAGTLMCIGGHELYIGDLGELGPLDVQIVKADEMDERKSGLVAEAAFEKLREEAFEFFMNTVQDIGNSNYRVTLKTAFETAASMTAALFGPIFGKLDPITIGEDYRSNRLALAYADRLNVHAKNLIRNRQLDALDNLLSGYYSHGFVIDLKEAETLFKFAKPPTEEMNEIIGHLGADAIWPRNQRRDQTPRLEFLNDEAPQSGQSAGTGTGGGGRKPSPARSGGGGRNRPPKLPGDSPEGGREKQVANNP